VSRKFKDVLLNATLYNLRDIEFTDFIKKSNLTAASEVMNICLKALETIISEIINPELDFEADDSNERSCGYCVFSALCK
jgi:uncharacterized membrane protein YwzB